MKFQMHTFGCKVNTYDSGLVENNLSRHGFSEDRAHGGIHVLNTCAVTGEASLEAVRLVRRIRSRDPLATVVVTGCAAQVDTDLFSSLPGVDLVVANSHKGSLPEILRDYFKGNRETKVYKSNIFRKEDLEAGGGLESQHSRAFIKIQDGCNSFCSYCIIPYARGKSRSIPVVDLVRRCLEVSKMGFQEVVLTGVHIGDYQDDSVPGRSLKLEDLIETLLAKTSVPRFRLTSLEPPELTPRLLDLYANERMCPHFHLSIQSASTPVLKAMKRKYGAEEVRWAFEEIHRRYPRAFVGMDVIAGFPTETEDDFLSTYKLLEETPWTRIHVFPYSERHGTRAAILEQIPMAERKARARRLRELSLQRYQDRAREQIGQTKSVLLLRKTLGENEQEVIRQAVSRDYWTLHVHCPKDRTPPVGEIQVRVTDLEPGARMEGVLRGIYVS